jgi:uncharacterized protein (DUF4415 family)
MTTKYEPPNEIQSWDEVPDFQDEEEEHRFWQSHSLGDALLTQMAASEGDPRLPAPRGRGAGRAQPISLRLDPDVLQRLKAIAQRQGIGYQTLLKQWVVDRLALEESGGQSTTGDSLGSLYDAATLVGQKPNMQAMQAVSSATAEISQTMAVASEQIAELARLTLALPVMPQSIAELARTQREALERTFAPLEGLHPMLTRTGIERMVHDVRANPSSHPIYAEFVELFENIGQGELTYLQQRKALARIRELYRLSLRSRSAAAHQQSLRGRRGKRKGGRLPKHEPTAAE